MLIKKIRMQGVLVLAVLVLVTPLLAAQELEENVRYISLQEAMALALERNFNIQLTALNAQGAYANLFGSYSVYDMTLRENFSFSERQQRQTSQFSASEFDSQSLSSTLSKNYWTGAQSSISLQMQRSASDAITTTLNPNYGNTLSLDVTQPVLQGFGRLATERSIIINQNNLKVSEIEFESQVITTLDDVQNRYWALVSAYEALDVAEDNLELANQQLEINRVKVRVGTLPEIDIIQAEQNVANSEASLLDAQIAVERAEDNLKTAIVTDDWNIKIRPTDSLLEPVGETYTFSEAYQTAIENRPEIRRLNVNIETNETNISYFQNQLKPRLDITGSLDFIGEGGTFNADNPFAPEVPDNLPLGFTESFSDLWSGENFNWSIGAVFTYTFGNRGARSQLMSSEIAKKQNQLRQQQLRYTIAVEVRNAIRELNASVAQMQARRKSLQYAEEQYEAEKKKFDLGTSTNFEVQTFQNQLAQARLNIITAQIRYLNARIEYQRALGLTLEDNNILITTEQGGVTGAEMQR